MIDLTEFLKKDPYCAWEWISIFSNLCKTCYQAINVWVVTMIWLHRLNYNFPQYTYGGKLEKIRNEKKMKGEKNKKWKKN